MGGGGCGICGEVFEGVSALVPNMGLAAKCSQPSPKKSDFARGDENQGPRLPMSMAEQRESGESLG